MSSGAGSKVRFVRQLFGVIVVAFVVASVWLLTRDSSAIGGKDAKPASVSTPEVHQLPDEGSETGAVEVSRREARRVPVPHVVSGAAPFEPSPTARSLSVRLRDSRTSVAGTGVGLEFAGTKQLKTIAPRSVNATQDGDRRYLEFAFDLPDHDTYSPVVMSECYFVRWMSSPRVLPANESTMLEGEVVDGPGVSIQLVLPPLSRVIEWAKVPIVVQFGPDPPSHVNAAANGTGSVFLPRVVAQHRGYRSGSVLELTCAAGLIDGLVFEPSLSGTPLRLEVMIPGFERAKHTFVLGQPGEVLELTIAITERQAETDFRATVWVRSESGESVSGATVCTLSPIEGHEILAVTDADGRASLDMVGVKGATELVRDVRVSANGFGPVSVRAQFADASHSSAVTEVVLSPGGLRIGGEFVDVTTKEPIAGVAVRLDGQVSGRSEWATIQSVTTMQSGAYEFLQVPSIRLRLSFHCPGYWSPKNEFAWTASADRGSMRHPLLRLPAVEIANTGDHAYSCAVHQIATSPTGFVDLGLARFREFGFKDDAIASGWESVRQNALAPLSASLEVSAGSTSRVPALPGEYLICCWRRGVDGSQVDVRQYLLVLTPDRDASLTLPDGDVDPSATKLVAASASVTWRTRSGVTGEPLTGALVLPGKWDSDALAHIQRQSVSPVTLVCSKFGLNESKDIAGVLERLQEPATRAYIESNSARISRASPSIAVVGADGQVSAFAMSGGSMTIFHPLAGCHYVEAGMSHYDLDPFARGTSLEVLAATPLTAIIASNERATGPGELNQYVQFALPLDSTGLRWWLAPLPFGAVSLELVPARGGLKSAKLVASDTGTRIGGASRTSDLVFCFPDSSVLVAQYLAVHDGTIR